MYGYFVIAMWPGLHYSVALRIQTKNMENSWIYGSVLYRRFFSVQFYTKTAVVNGFVQS